MKKLAALGIAAVAMMIPVAPAMAANVHFVSGTSAQLMNDGSVVVSAKVAGLGNGTYNWQVQGNNIQITAGCRTKSGQFPNGTQSFAGTPSYTTGNNGTTVNGSLSINTTLQPNYAFGSCPTGQSFTITGAIGYVSVTIDGVIFPDNRIYVTR